MGRSRHPTSGKRRWQTFNSCCLIFLFHQTGGIKVMVGLRWFSAVKNEHHRRLLLSLFFILVSGLLSNNCLGNELSAAAAPAQHHRRLRSTGLGSSNLGKRITSSLVAELGKRPKEMFSFGIGKRSISDDEMEEFLAEESHAKQAAAAAAEEDSHNNDLYHVANKRDPYAFGLGKRGEYNFGLGKKRDPYAFGLGKRSGNDYA